MPNQQHMLTHHIEIYSVPPGMEEHVTYSFSSQWRRLGLDDWLSAVTWVQGECLQPCVELILG